MKLNLKIFNVNKEIDVAKDWNIQAESADLEAVLAQSYRIACVPAMFNCADNFAYSPKHATLDLAQFDLVVISDIEQASTQELMVWIERCQISPSNYVLAQGSWHESEGINNATTVVRFWWMQNLMRMNTLESIVNDSKPFWFDVLLGARRPHRDYVMLSMQKHPRLLDQSIVNYRSEFYTGAVVDYLTNAVRDCFPDLKLNWPHVSKNLDPSWEVQDTIEKSISPYVPWNIYRQTWYSAVCETGFTGNAFFLTEKTAKVMFAKRVFVMFGPQNFLKHLQDFGFKTFASVIDESYDMEPLDIIRYRQAFGQMLSLAQQDPASVYKKLQPVLEHNHQRLWELQQETQQRQQELLRQHIPTHNIIN
jgi:hypothetical protein